MTFGAKSLRARITTAAVVVVGIVLTIAAVLIVVIQRDQLLANVDASLEREAADVAAILQSNGAASLGERGTDRFAQVLAGDGSVIAASSRRLDDAAVVAPDALAEGARSRFLTSSSVPIEDDQFRLFVSRVEIGGEGVLIVVGENNDDLRDSVWALAASLAVMVLLATAILGGVAWIMVGRTLAPVGAIRRRVGHITLHRLGERVPVPDAHDEIAELAVTMNEMLDRLDQANERQQRFVADASHELRSPLTRLRTSLEVDLADPDRDLNETGAELLDDVEALQVLVNDLLFLARTDDESLITLARVDLDAVVDRVVDRMRGSAEVPIDTRSVAAVEVRGHEGHLGRLVTNIVANAIRHASGQVWIEAEEVAGVVTLVIEDDGPGIAETDRERVFERFTRLDDSRTGATGGAGLGLAIAKEIARTHGGGISVSSGRAGGARFVVTLSAWDSSPS